MLILLSPAKTLDFSKSLFKRFTIPEFFDDAWILAKELKKLSEKDIVKLMNVSEKIAKINFDRFQDFEKKISLDNAKQAIFAYKGDVYRPIPIEKYNEKDLDFMQNHVRIISGLFGIVRPLDLIEPYRLEMRIELKTAKAKNLYEFWEDKITQSVNNTLKAQNDEIVLNLASQEYFSAVNRKQIKGKIIDIYFKEKRGKDYKIFGILAKKARGMMTDFVTRNRIENLEKVKDFDKEGYKFNEKMSSADNFVFIRS